MTDVHQILPEPHAMDKAGVAVRGRGPSHGAQGETDGETCVVSPDKTQEPGLQLKTMSLFSATVPEPEQGHLPSCAVLELVVLLAQRHGCRAENCWLQPPLRPAFPLSLP